RQIVAEVEEIAAAVGTIAESAAQGASRLEDLNVAVGRIDGVTQQNAAMVEETTAASHTLCEETERLNGLVGRFQVVRDGPAGNRRPDRRATAGQPARPARTQLASASR